MGFFNTLLVDFDWMSSNMDELRGTSCIVLGRILAGAGFSSAGHYVGTTCLVYSPISHHGPWGSGLEALKCSAFMHSALPLQNLVVSKVHLLCWLSLSLAFPSVRSEDIQSMFGVFCFHLCGDSWIGSLGRQWGNQGFLCAVCMDEGPWSPLTLRWVVESVWFTNLCPSVVGLCWCLQSQHRGRVPMLKDCTNMYFLPFSCDQCHCLTSIWTGACLPLLGLGYLQRCWLAVFHSFLLFFPGQNQAQFLPCFPPFLPVPYGPPNSLPRHNCFWAYIVEIMEDQGNVCCSSYNMVITSGLFYG